MKLSLKNSIYQAIIHNKWLDVSYVNKKEETTYYFLGIKDINIEKGILICDIFNRAKGTEVLECGRRDLFVYVDSIKTATVLEQSYYDTPKALIDKVTADKRVADYLEVVNFDNNILRYLSDCYRLDNDPFLKEVVMVEGIDVRTLTKTGKYQLSNLLPLDLVQPFLLLIDPFFLLFGYRHRFHLHLELISQLLQLSFHHRFVSYRKP